MKISRGELVALCALVVNVASNVSKDAGLRPLTHLLLWGGLSAAIAAAMIYQSRHESKRLDAMERRAVEGERRAEIAATQAEFLKTVLDALPDDFRTVLKYIADFGPCSLERVPGVGDSAVSESLQRLTAAELIIGERPAAAGAAYPTPTRWRINPRFQDAAQKL